jgi:hypothetical protein
MPSTPDPPAPPKIALDVIEQVKRELDRLTRERDQVQAFYDRLIAATKAPFSLTSKVAIHAPDESAARALAEAVVAAAEKMDETTEPEPTPEEPQAVEEPTADEATAEPVADHASQGLTKEGKVRQRAYTTPMSPAERIVQIRDWVVKQDKPFNNRDLSAAIGIKSNTYASKLIEPLVEQGTVKILEKKGGPGGGYVYAYAGKPQPTNPPRPNGNVEPPIGVSAPKAVAPVPGTGKKTVTLHKDVATLLDRVRGQVNVIHQPDGHVKVQNRRTGQSTNISSSPSDVNAVHQVRRDLQRIGVYIPTT